MKTSINYSTSSFGPFEGNSIQEIIESHFSILEPIILEKLGNAAGYNLDSVYAEYNTIAKTAELHVFASGSDTLLHHDPAQLESKELIFTLPGITQDDLPERYNFELIEEESFNPYSNPANISAKLGILEAAVDYMADITHQKRPAETLNSQMPNLRRESTQVYLTRLMMMFGFLPSRKTGLTANLKDLIQRMVISLQDVTKITSFFSIPVSSSDSVVNEFAEIATVTPAPSSIVEASSIIASAKSSSAGFTSTFLVSVMSATLS